MSGNTNIGAAFAAIKAEMERDPSYAWGWQCNFAVPIMDITGIGRAQANQAAALIMMQIFGHDIATNPHCDWPKHPAQEYFEMRVAAERAEDTAHDPA